MSECPKCGGTDIAWILYGLPRMTKEFEKKLKDKEIILGGCVTHGNDPKLECNDCGWRF